MDVQQLTDPASDRTARSLRTVAVPGGSGSPVIPPEWWIDGEPDRPVQPRSVGGDQLAPHRVTRTLVAVGAIVALAACVTAALALLSGMRWFVVETPSMGTAAPVGTLVVTKPAPALLTRGDVIAFTPPGLPRVYTHRVFAVAADGSVRTKGDINGAPDPWTIQRSHVLGRAVAIVPVAGTVLRGTPPFIVGALLLWMVTTPIRRRDRRASARVIGLHLIGTVVILWLHPFVQMVLLATENAADGVRASIVSTGLLPIRLVDSAGTVLARLTDGRPQVVDIPRAANGVDRLNAMPDLGPLLQLALIGVALIPSLVVLIVGLPREPEAEEVAAT